MKKVIIRLNGVFNINNCNLLKKGLKKNKNIKRLNINTKTHTIMILCKRSLEIEKIERNIEELGFKSLGVDLITSTSSLSILPFIILGIVLAITLYLSIGKIFSLPLTDILSIKQTSILVTILTILFLLYGREIIKDGIVNFIKGTSNLNSLSMISILGTICFCLYDTFSKSTINHNYIYL